MTILHTGRPTGATARTPAIPPGEPIRIAAATTIGRLSALAHPIWVALMSLAGGVALAVWTTFTVLIGSPVDARCYYAVDPFAPYWRLAYQFIYTPVAAQAIAPLQLLSFEAFAALLRAAEMLALFALTGPLLPLVVFWSPLASEINAANINLLIVAVAVWGLRWPVLWSFVLLTKVTPGVGLLWFAARREWRNLAIALGVTVALATASFVVAPGTWIDYVAFMQTLTPSDGVPLWARVGIAAAIVVWGARTDRRWTVVVAVTIALPRLYLQSPAMLVGLLYYVRPTFSDLGRWAGATLRAVGQAQPSAQSERRQRA